MSAKASKFRFTAADWRRVDAAAVKLARKVAPLYRQLNWVWGDRGFPSEAQILAELRESIAWLRGDPKGEFSECGGLRAERRVIDGESEIALSFKVEEAVTG